MTKPAVSSEFREVGGTGLEPVTPSLSNVTALTRRRAGNLSFHRGFRPLAPAALTGRIPVDQARFLWIWAPERSRCPNDACHDTLLEKAWHRNKAGATFSAPMNDIEALTLALRVGMTSACEDGLGTYLSVEEVMHSFCRDIHDAPLESLFLTIVE
jgi:hypothetical protein